MFTFLKRTIKTVKPGDRNWYIDNNFIRTPRAGFEISMNCPAEYRTILNECIQYGWLTPVAYMKDSEQMWEELGG
jgi:hypothetical protein